MSDWKVIVPAATTNYVRNPSAGATETLGNELLSNTGFETAGGGDPDFFGSWTENAGDGAIADSATAQAGTHAAALTAGATANTYIYQSATVTPGRTYRVSFWTRGDATNDGRYRVYDVTNTTFLIAATATGVTAATYAYKEQTFVAPVGCVSLRVYLNCPLTNAGIAYFDTVSIVEVNAGTARLGDAADVTLSLTYSAYGAYSYNVVTAADNEGALIALSVLPNAAHYATALVRGTLPAAWDWSLDGVTYTEPTLLMAMDSDWSLYGCAFPAAQCAGRSGLRVLQKGAGSGNFYLDGLQVEATELAVSANGSFETAGAAPPTFLQWSETASDGAIADETTLFHIGAHALKLTAGASVDTRAYQSVAVTAGQSYTLSLYTRVATGDSAGRYRIYDSTNTADIVAVVTTGITSTTYTHMSATFTTPAGCTEIMVYLYCPAVDTDIAYFDAVWVTETPTATWTTYCDGERPGCEWLGAEHNSASSRSAISREGGVVTDLEDTYGLAIEGFIGLGMAPRAVSQSGYGGQPGGALNNSVRTSRPFTVTGLIESTSYTDLLAKRNALIDALSPEAYPRGADGWQPVVFWSTAGTTAKSIRAHYEAGLELDHNWQLPVNERVAMRFLAPDPNWYALTDTATTLDANDTATLRYVAGRLKSTGQWDDLGLTADPAAGGAIATICVASDKNVYVGGNFDGLNNDVPAGMDYIARYVPSSASWEVVGTASAFGGIVSVIKEGPDGKLYIGGDFYNVGGTAAMDMIVSYNPTTNAFAALGTPGEVGGITDMAWDSAGNLYVVGSFVDLAGVAACDGIAKWNGTAWSALGTPGPLGVSEYINTIAIDADDNIFVGGDFANLDGIAEADGWAWWNGTAWASVDGIALSSAAWTLMFDQAGTLYVGGAFTDADAVANADYIFAWTGTNVDALDIGANDQVWSIGIAPDGKVIATGGFTTVGSLSTTDRIAAWNGSTWLPLDVNLSGAPVTYSVAFGTPDATVPSNYDMFIGWSTTGAATFAGDTTVTNPGTAPAYPRIIIKRSGGTSARIVSVRNHTTGKELSFDYALLDGETLTVDTHPDRQTCESSFYGARPGAILAGSDLGSFMLLPGANTITTFVDDVGSPTITAYMLWAPPFDGVDD